MTLLGAVSEFLVGCVYAVFILFVIAYAVYEQCQKENDKHN